MHFNPMSLSRREALAAGSLLLLPNSISMGKSGKNLIAGKEFTKKSVASYKKGTKWLLKAMNRDGGIGVDINYPSDIACTCMSAFALFSQGSTILAGKHSKDVRRMVNYVIKQARTMPAGDITNQANTQVQRKIGRHAHSFFAGILLSQAIGEAPNTPHLKRSLHKVIKAICNSQTNDGHWGVQSWAPTLGTVMGWVSLRASHFAGLKVKGSATKTANYLVGLMKQNLGTRRGNWMHTLYKNSTGVRVLYSLGQDDNPIAKQALKDVLSLVNRDNTAFTQAGGEEFLAFQLITDTLLQKQGEDWKAWYPTVRDKLVSVQNSDGSWTGHHCITSRTFCTAAACQILTSPNRYLPISQQ